MFSLFFRPAFRAQRSRYFSWKSRLGRDPEIRQKKQEALKVRYNVRRFGELDELKSGEPAHASWITSITDSARTRFDEMRHRIQKLTNISFLEREDILSSQAGDSVPLRDLVLSVAFPNPRTAVIVVKDKGNTERVYKSLKRAFPTALITLMDRERVEMKLPMITEELRISRGEDVERQGNQLRKDLKKLELQAYERIRKGSFTAEESQGLRENIRKIFVDMDGQIDSLLEKSIDKLGLE